MLLCFVVYLRVFSKSKSSFENLNEKIRNKIVKNQPNCYQSFSNPIYFFLFLLLFCVNIATYRILSNLTWLTEL